MSVSMKKQQKGIDRSWHHYASDSEHSVNSKPAAVNVVKISKDGKYVNNFIATRTAAVQQRPSRTESQLMSSVDLPLDKIYLRKLSKEQRSRQMRLQTTKHRSVQRKEVEQVNPLSESVLQNVLESLVELVRSTEVVRFLTTLRSSILNETVLEPTVVAPPVLDKEGEVVCEEISDLYVAVVSNSQSGVEESAILLFRQENQASDNSEGSRSFLDDDLPDEEEENNLKEKASLAFLPDTPQEIMSAASKFMREKKSKSRLRSARAPKVKDLKVLAVFQVMSETKIRLSGGGKVEILSNGNSLQIDTVSVRSMWGFVMAVQRSRDLARDANVKSHELTHSWISFYFDDNTTVPLTQTVLDPEDFKDLELVPDENERVSESKLLRESDGEETDANYDADNEHFKPRKRDLMTSIKRIILKYDIEDITMGDVYRELVEQYGENIIGEKGFSKSVIDTFTMRAVGQTEPPTKIVDNLFLGSEYNAVNKSEMEELGVTLVVNVTEEVEDFFPDFFKYHSIHLKDVPSSDLKPHFRAAIRAIEKAKSEGGSVLVHCQRGVSRSASVVIAYLMSTQGGSFEENLNFVVSKRPIVRPNEGFRQQLQEFEAELKQERDGVDVEKLGV